MSLTDEYFAAVKEEKKKKKEQKTGDTLTDGYYAAIAEEEYAPTVTLPAKGSSFASIDIAPLGDMVSMFGPKITPTTKDDDEEDRKWFDAGAFDDGYQFGDVFKTILGTDNDILKNMGQGARKMAENAIDFGADMIGQAADKLGADNLASKMKDFVKKDISTESPEVFAPLSRLILNNPTLQPFTTAVKGISTLSNLVNGEEDNSVLGDRADSVVQSATRYAIQAGLGGAGVPWQVTAGVTSYGAEAENAYNNDASHNEAALSALVSAGGEVLGEYLTGGAFGAPGLDDLATKSFARDISNKTLRSVLKYSTKALGEPLEEVFSWAVERVGQKLTYANNKTWKELYTSDEAKEELVDAIVSSLLISGTVQGADVVKAKQQGVDYTSGLTANEEKVVDKVYRELVAKAEKNGKVTNKQKNAIYDEVLRDMERGYISTDTIEEVLGGDEYTAFKGEYDNFFGGETYKAYKDTITSEGAQIKELEAQLKALENEPDTIGNRNKYNALENQIEQLKNSATRAELKAKLDSEAARIGGIKQQLRTNVSELVKDSRLYESYQELARSHEKFTADVSKYTNEHAKKTIQNIMDSGVAVNTNEFHEFADWLAKISADKGMTFSTTDARRLKGTKYDVEGKNVHGFIDENGNVTLNMDSDRAGQITVGHELTHVLEGTEFYKELHDAVKNYATTKLGQDGYNAKLEEFKRLYEGKGDPDKELTADLIGEYVFTDTEFIHNLSVQHRNVFQKIYDEIKYLFKVATAGSKEARELEKVKKAFEDAYRAEGEAQSDTTKYHLSSNAKTELHKALYDTKYRSEVLLRDVSPAIMTSQKGVKNLPMAMNASHIRENVFTEAEAKKRGLRVNDSTHYHGLGEDFFLKIIDGLDNVKVAYRGTKNASDPARRENYFLLVSEFKDDAGNTVNVPVYIDEHAQVNRVFVDVNKISTVFGRDAFQEYINRQVQKGDLVRIKNKDTQSSERPAPIAGGYGKDVSTEAPTTATTQNAIGDIQGTSFGDNVTQGQENVKYSLSDSDGKQLSKEQQEYFKDSKVRDENGNLKVMYHGTPNGDFTVFKDGTYFTDNKEYADRYQNPSASSISSGKTATNPKTFEVYLDIKKPFDISDPEAREIYINEYIKGGNALGINPYLSDAEYRKIKTIDWTEGEDLRDFLIDNEYDYDGLVLDEGADGGYGDDVAYRGKSYVVFSPEQVKNVDNQAPTSDPDIHRSLSNVGEEVDNHGLAPLNKFHYQEEAAPAQEETVAENATVEENLFPDDAYAPVAKPKQSVAMNAPVAAKYEAVRPKKQTEPRMAKATPAEMAAYHGQQTMKGFEPKTAKVLTDEPKVDPKKPKAWNLFKDNIVDKGTVFETMSLKTGNRELQGKWKAIGRAESSAQWFMEHGNAEASSLKSIRETVEKSGKTKKFYEYLYHMHNVDRMSLVERNLDTEDKPVFGYGMTSDMSKAEAAKLEKANPEFKRWAKDVYSYNQAQREMMVENGLISKETADLWEKKYPHYVPVRRVGDEGLNINVALDTKKTGVNAPIKKATGGNRDILPLFDTMAMRTEQTFKAIAKNRFGVELKNMLGTTIDTGEVSVDEMIDSVDMQDSLLQEGKGGNNPTFTVFENGERVTFEITEEMYDTMKPKGKFASYTNKALNTLNNVRRGLLTEYNPAFMLTNPIKDTQDVMINSQHPARTYANYPKAAAELLKKGQYYQEYMEHGGEMNTYFDGETKTFAKEKSGLSKAIGFPLEAISTVNNFIERVPRMAEYIASRKMGRSIDVSMLDAARVTTDFSAGGDFVKTLNRNGFTFLNASVQGAAQQVRNVREAKAEGLKGWAKLATKIAVAGLPSILLNNLLWDDDEEYAELSDYVKQNYYVVAKYGDGKFVRIPKGRALAVIQNGFEQMQNLITGNDEIDFDAFAELVISNLAPSNPLENNLIAPIIQAKNNETWYGDDLVPSRLQDLPAAEQYDETTDSISKWLGEKLNISPYKINYLLDQYSGGVGDVFLPMLTPEAERGNDSKWADLIAPISDKFTTDSVLKNQNVTDFYSKRDELEVVSNGRNATKEDMLKKVFVDAVSWEMSDLYAQKREIQNSDMSDAEKYETVREIQKKINALAESGLNGYEAVYSDGAYAEVGDRRFNYYKDKDTWYEIKEKNADGSDNWYYTQEQLFRDKLGVSYADYWNDKFDPAKNHVKTHYGEMNGKRYNYSEENNMWYEIKQKNDDGTDNWYYQKEQEVTKGLGISYTKYWNNREEYNFAYDHPQTYALAKAVGGYKTYMPYYDALENWQSDTYIASDKDENGDTIYNSRKKKVQTYLKDLDIPEMDKLLLYKSVYNSYDDRNYEIIDYLNKSDLTFEETVNALRGLGFDVTDDGAISWK